jgi:hypothetical protein
MKINGEKIIKTEREVKLDDPSLVVAAKPQPDQEPPATARPAKAPSMRRPGEVAPTAPSGYPSSPPPVQVPDPQTGPPKDYRTARSLDQ